MNLRRIAAAAAGVLMAFAVLLPPAHAQRQGPGRGDLILLGEKVVGFTVDRDVINIGHNEDWFRSRTFRSLRFVAERNDVFMMRIRLVYINGHVEDLRVDQLIRQRSELPVDLRGERSFLRSIEMIYRSRPNFRGEAVIRVFGEPGRPMRPEPGPMPGGAWVELGCQQVSFIGRDRDTVRVGRREGRFKAIRLHVRGADVEMLDLKVVYANGDPDDLPVRSVLRQGERTRPMDLRGFQRAIERVDMVYRTIPNFKGMATVCVEGLQ